MFRWLTVAILLGALIVSAWHRHRARRKGGGISRIHEGWPLMLGRALGGLVLFGGVVLYAVKPTWMQWASFEVAPWLRWAGLVLGVATVASVHWVPV